MLHILLLILKIIGIILGVLLGIVLLGIVLVLFVPVRYKVEAKRKPETAMPVEVKAKVTWLLHLVNIRLAYSGELKLKARIFLFTVFRLPKKQKASEADTGDAVSHKAQKKRKKEENAISYERSKEEESMETADPKADSIEAGEPEAAQEKEKRRFSLKRLFLKIYRIFQNIWYTITGICDKIKLIWENIEYYRDVLQGETFKQSFSLCKDELTSIFSYLKPRKLQADLVIGMGDPAATAKVLSYYGMLYPIIGEHVTIEPDFDEKRIEGTALVQGKIKVFTFLKAAVRIYFSKDIRKLLKLLKKEDV